MIIIKQISVSSICCVNPIIIKRRKRFIILVVESFVR